MPRGSGTIHMWGGAIYGGNAMNLCADPNVDNRFVAFSNYDFYIYASTDGGASFRPINKTRPFAVENGVWAKIFGIPGQNGHFYFCQGAGPSTKAPLWKSTDGGATWASANPNLTKVLMAGWGKAISGATLSDALCLWHLRRHERVLPLHRRGGQLGQDRRPVPAEQLHLRQRQRHRRRQDHRRESLHDPGRQQPGIRNLQAVNVGTRAYFLAASSVTPLHWSVRNGEAGRPSWFARFGSAASRQA